MAKEKVDCLFVHVPSFATYKSYEAADFMVMPLGLLAIADHLQRNSYNARVIHLGLKKIRNPKFSLEGYLNSIEANIIAIPLHWAGQSFHVIETVKEIKRINPKLITVLGGFTASFFNREIMDHFQEVDFIIRGDGEIPLLKLAQELSRPKPDLSQVPNLTWRDGKRIMRNEQWYVATKKDIDNLNFTNFGLLEESDLYGRLRESQVIFSESTMSSWKRFFLCIGRGCATNCTFCGGSKFSQKLINNRCRPVFRSLGKVLKDIKKAKKSNFDEIYIGFDPYPNHRYFIELFSLIQKAKIDISVIFECWSLPTRKFIDEFRKTFREDSKIMISPETGSEKLRCLHRGYSYSNIEFLSFLKYLDQKRIFSLIFFSYPLPFSTKDDLKKTQDLKQKIETKFGKYSKAFVNRLSLDPASKLYCYPGKYKILTKLKSFLDYYQRFNAGLSYLFAEDTEKEFKGLFLPLFNRQNAKENLLGIAFSFFIIGKYSRALTLAKQVLKIGEKGGYIIIIQNYIRLRKFQESLREIKSAEKKSKEILFLSELRFLEAQTRYGLREYNQALALAREASKFLSEIKQRKGYFLLLGASLEKCKQYREAIVNLKEAEKRDPGEGQINFSIFNCYRHIGRINLANKELEKWVSKSKKLIHNG